MNILSELSLIFGICLVGEAISLVLPFPFPGGVISMMILLVLLLIGAVKLRHVEKTANFLLSNLQLFFIPASVSIIQYLDVIRENLVALLVVIIVSTFLTFAATVYAIRGVLRLQRRLGSAGTSQKGS